MGLNIRPSTSRERKQIFIEALLNATDKVSKVADGSILSGVAEGIAKVSGKAEKDVMLAVSQLFPDTSFGSQLDQVAANFGVPPRYQDLGSSTYVFISADPMTAYLANTHLFYSTDGIVFELEDDVTIGQFGIGYAKVKSTSSGSKTNVAPLSISKVSPAPSGHINVVNQVKATGGRDVEGDEMFRIRIKNGANILAKGTLAALEQVFIKLNPKVLKIFHQGTNHQGKVIITIATQNGVNLDQNELDDLLVNSSTYFGLSEYRPFGTNFYGIELRNQEYENIDIAFRCQLDNNVDPDKVRQDIQVNITKYLDFRFFDSSTSKVEWDNLLDIVKNTKGMKYVPDQYFYPRNDIGIVNYKLPRLRGFLMLDMEGAVISNFTGTLSPVYYPNVVDDDYMSTILASI